MGEHLPIFGLQSIAWTFQRKSAHQHEALAMALVPAKSWPAHSSHGSKVGEYDVLPVLGSWTV